MKIRHINGIKVCTVEDTLNKVVTAYHYKDVVKALNKIFREAELSEYSNPDRDPMGVVLLMLAGSCKIDFQKYKPQDIIYDDEIPKKTTITTRLKLPRFTESQGIYRGLKVIDGGKPTNTN
jgi:hypothetical protein